MTDTTLKNATFGVNPALSAASKGCSPNSSMPLKSSSSVIPSISLSCAIICSKAFVISSVVRNTSETKETANTENLEQATDEMDESAEKLTTDEIFLRKYLCVLKLILKTLLPQLL